MIACDFSVRGRRKKIFSLSLPAWQETRKAALPCPLPPLRSGSGWLGGRGLLLLAAARHRQQQCRLAPARGRVSGAAVWGRPGEQRLLTSSRGISRRAWKAFAEARIAGALARQSRRPAHGPQLGDHLVGKICRTADEASQVSGAVSCRARGRRRQSKPAKGRARAGAGTLR